MTVTEAAFSDLINKPKATLLPLTGSSAHSIRLRRRDDVDLMLTTADRFEQDHQVVVMAVRLFSVLVLHREVESMLALVPEIFPWVRFLPESDRRRLLEELIGVLQASQDFDTFAPVTQLINEWRHTAEVYADPDVLAALTGGADDFGPVPEPPAA
jgi:hypothetical protein